MPGKKKKYNSRFPPARIKKIMQADEDIGKVAAAVPVIISRTIERFIHSLLSRAGEVALSKNVRTLTPSHIKQSILSQPRLYFMLDNCKDIPDDGSGPIPQGFQPPSNSVFKKEIKEEEEDMETLPPPKESQLKRSFSAPETSLTKRKRGRPRKVKPFIDEHFDENGSNSDILNNVKEEDRKVAIQPIRPKLTSSVSTANFCDAEYQKMDKSFLGNIKISIPGFPSSSVTIGAMADEKSSTDCAMAVSPASVDPFVPSTNAVSNAAPEVDEDYD